MSTVRVYEGTIGKHAWKQILVIEDGCVFVLDMQRAAMGWNLREITIQGADAWAGMSEAQIVAWKSAADHAMREATEHEATFALSKIRGPK